MTDHDDVTGRDHVPDHHGAPGHDGVTDRDPRGVQVEVVDAAVLGRRGAALAATALRDAVARRGIATMAFSGGATPVPMFAALATEDVPWSDVHVLQVDERVAPDGHEDRNWEDLRAHLVDRVPVPAANVHPMPVTAVDLDDAAARYGAVLADLVDGGALDVAHLGIGDDGHTASLVPGWPELDEQDRLVVATAEAYRGRRRMTMTVPPLRAAALQLWLVAGGEKATALRRLRERDEAIPATHVLADDALVLADGGAAGA